MDYPKAKYAIRDYQLVTCTVTGPEQEKKLPAGWVDSVTALKVAAHSAPIELPTLRVIEEATIAKPKTKSDDAQALADAAAKKKAAKDDGAKSTVSHSKADDQVVKDEAAATKRAGAT